MIQGSIISNKKKFLFLFFLFAVAILWVSIDQPIQLFIGNKKIISWFLWIVFYLLAQFSVAAFVGRVIKGTKNP
jgi:hypothetical protein